MSAGVAGVICHTNTDTLLITYASGLSKAGRPLVKCKIRETSAERAFFITAASIGQLYLFRTFITAAAKRRRAGERTYEIKLLKT